MIKFIPYLLFLVIIVIMSGCYFLIQVLIPELELSVVIDSEQIKKKTFSEHIVAGKIQLTDFHSSPELEISILGGPFASDPIATGSHAIWFLSTSDYKKLAAHYFRDGELGLGVGFDENTELLDINNDGIFEIMPGGGGFQEVGLLDSKGNTLWTFQPYPHETSTPPHRMILGDLNNDSIYEFYAAHYDGLYQLDDKGKVIWKVNNQASDGPSVEALEIFIDRRNNKGYLITLNDVFNYDGVFQIYDYQGRKIRRFPTPFPIMDFEIVEWNETVYILAGYSSGSHLGNKAVLMDLAGKITHNFELENFPGFESQGIAVKFSPDEAEYLVLLAHSKNLGSRTLLNIISPKGEIIYQEIVVGTTAFTSLNVPDKNKEVLIIGGDSGNLFEYEMRTN